MCSRKYGKMHMERLLIMSDLYKRIEELCHREGINITTMCRESGASRASLTDLKMGRKQSLSSDTLTKIAAYFRVSVDYLLGRTEDPIDYANDGDALAEIPLSYIEACNGDTRAARAMMLAVDEDAQKEKAPTPEGERTVTDDDLKAAFYGGYSDELPATVIDELWNDAKEYAKFKAEQRKSKKQ